VFFDVLPDRTVTRFRTNYLREDCDGPLYVYGTLDFGMTSFPIGADGSFRYSTTYNETVGDTPATLSFEVTGQLSGITAAGTVLGTSEFDYQGRHWKCTSTRRTWTATRVP
jgi:hypothetical protein